MYDDRICIESKRNNSSEKNPINKKFLCRKQLLIRFCTNM